MKEPVSLETVREKERESYTLINIIARNCNGFYMPKNRGNLSYSC